MSEAPTSRREEGFIGAVEELATTVGRLGYGLLHLPLQLLPNQTRTHMHNVIRELSYGFASLPRDFADIASHGIEAWIDDGKEQPADVLLGAAGPGATVAPEATPADVLIPTPSIPSPGMEVGSSPTRRDLGPTRRVGVLNIPETPPSAPADGGTRLYSSVVPEGLNIAHIEYDPPGPDLEGEYVLIRNTSDTAIDMTGWSLHDDGLNHVFTFPSFALAANSEVKVWSKSGKNDAQNLYWQNKAPVWNNSGDTGTLRLPTGETVSSYTYSGK
jgi:hypothetical protein